MNGVYEDVPGFVELTQHVKSVLVPIVRRRLVFIEEAVVCVLYGCEVRVPGYAQNVVRVQVGPPSSVSYDLWVSRRQSAEGSEQQLTYTFHVLF